MPNENTTPVITRRYYPTLASIVSPEDFPDILGFIKEGITNLFDKIHYKDLQYSKSPRGDAAFYSLSIVSPNRIDIEIPGTGIYLVLNPDIEGNDFNISSFPITIEYEWQILAYLREFSLGNFSFAPQEIFEIALRVLNLTQEQAIAQFINTFTEPIDGASLLEQFKDDVEQSLGIQIIDVTEETKLTEIVESIYTEAGEYATLASFAVYILKNDLDETWVALKKFFRGLLPKDIEAYVKNILVPKFRATLLLRAAIEFPRSVLTPVYDEDGKNPFKESSTGEPLEVIPADDQGDPKVLLSFAEALFYADTEKGLGYNMELVLNTNVPAQIGNTGLIIDIQNLKIDLSRTENIVEADFDSRPPEFVGVYMDYSAIILPKKWFNNEVNHPGTTAKLAGYNLLIGTGGVSGKIALEAIEAAPKKITSFYEDCFSFQYPVSIIANGKTTSIPNYSQLLVYLNELDGATYQFKFPLTTTMANGTVNEDMSSADFATLLANCNSNAPAPRLVKTIGKKGFEVWFTSFDITFKQGSVVESNIQGGLKIPRLKDANGDIAEIEIKGHLDNDGDFLVTASEKDGFKPLSLPNIVNITIHTLELGRQDSNYFIGVSCDLLFTNQIMKKLLNDQPIKVPRVRIYDDGSFEIVSGVIEVPTNFTLDLGPVQVAITNINFGSYQQEYQGKMRRYNVFGFDGGISVNPLGVDARGEGIKYYYTTDDNTTDASGNPLPPDHPDYKPHHSYIRIQTIRVDLVIPGNASADSATAIIKGYLSIGEDEYTGGVSLKLPKAKIAGSAEMSLKPKYPAFIVDASLEIPTPLPLGSTGLGVYGFRGILGFRYVAEKEAVGLKSGEDTWYDYYTYPPRGINISKFSTPEVTGKYKNPVSLGAGASIATYGNEDVISFRVMLLLSIPSLFMIEGKASIISKRYGLDDSGEPPFFAFLAIGDNSIEAGAGADFKLPQDSGNIFTLYAEVQAGFFFKNPSAWYVNVGTKDKPISARVLTIVTAESYLMLSATGIEAGARASFEFDKRFGPVRVRATLAVAIGGYVSFERPQFGAYFAIEGRATVDVKIISVEISLDLILSAEAPKPFLIYGKFRLCVSVRVVFFRVRFCGGVELKWEKSRHVDRTPIAPLLPEQTDTVKAVHMLNGEVFDLIELSGSISNPSFIPDTDDARFNTNIIPVDSYIDIKFDKAMLPNNVASKIGGVNNPPEGYTDLIPPKKVVNGKTVRQVKHLYSVEQVEIKAAVGNTWVDYHPYEAIDSTVDTANLKLGQWQKSSNEYNAIRLLGNSPFSYTEQAEPEWFVPEQIGVTAASLFCQGTNREKSSSNWLKQTLNKTYVEDNEFRNQSVSYFLKGGSYINVDNKVIGGKATVTNVSNVFNFEQSLQIDNNNQLEILLPEEAGSVTLTMTTFSQAVTVQFFASKIDDAQFEPSFIKVDEKEYSRDDLKASAVEYSGATPIIKIVISPKFPDLEAVQELQEKIRQLYVTAYKEEITAGYTQIIDPPRYLDTEQLYIFNNQLNALLEIGCSVCSQDDVAGGIGRMQVGNTLCVGGTPTTNTDCEGETRCYTLLHEVCWLNVEDYEFNLNIPQQDAIQQDYQSARDAITKVIAPVWRPNTKYYVHFKLKDSVDNGNSEGVFDYYFGFRTAGPVGHFHRDEGSTYGDIEGENNSIIEDSILNPDKYLLTSLRGYIDYNRSYPNADGNLLRAKPLFYGRGELAIFFTNPATYHMFTNWPAYKGMPALDAELKFFVKDPVTNEIIVNPIPPDVDVTTIPETIETWSVDNEPLMPTHIQTLNNFVKEQLSNPDLNCVLDGGELIKPASKFMTVTFKNNLKPLKMYNALVNNVFNGVTREVHNYVFQTSRYLNFEEQVNSYKLKDINGKIRDAVFTIEVNTTQESIQSAYNSIAGIEDANSKNLELQYLDIFDRVTEGLLKFKPIDPPETTEFNLLKDINTKKIIGVLIRNPEPFNDPKIPLSEVENSIAILNTDGSVNEDYKGLYSKDLSQILFMKNTLEVSESSLDINFKYLKWNGNNYQIDSEVKVSSINLKGK